MPFFKKIDFISYAAFSLGLEYRSINLEADSGF
jgi:hypothetical protein